MIDEKRSKINFIFNELRISSGVYKVEEDPLNCRYIFYFNAYWQPHTIDIVDSVIDNNSIEYIIQLLRRNIFKYICNLDMKERCNND